MTTVHMKMEVDHIFEMSYILNAPHRVDSVRVCCAYCSLWLYVLWII